MDAHQILQAFFHFDEFRPLQGKIVESLVQGYDTLALLPTGGGKSLCYQVPGLYFFQHEKLTLVISPLIALMKDQVDNLTRKNIPATFINHTLSESEQTQRINDIRQKKYVFIYVSPERLKNQQFLDLCQSLPIALIAIDEAHCISQWGHDFRPEYLQITQFIKQLPLRPIVAAFTATAPQPVKKEILRSLQMKDSRIFQDTFLRSNLFFSVVKCTDTLQQKLALVRLVHLHRNTPGIIYCSTRSSTERVAKLLQQLHFLCAFYHGGMKPEERTYVQDAFLKNDVPLIVATNAFGMGVDKPDIQFVIHFNFPGNLEAYYQEAGRAGRNGQQSWCYLLFLEEDIQPHIYLLGQKIKKASATMKQKLLNQLFSVTEYALQKHCRNIFLLRYLGEKNTHTKNHCQNCDVCQKNSVFFKQQSFLRKKLHRILLKSKKKKTLFPILTKQLIEFISIAQPSTKYEYAQLPGIGEHWIKKYYAFFAVECMPNLFYDTS